MMRGNAANGQWAWCTGPVHAITSSSASSPPLYTPSCLKDMATHTKPRRPSSVESAESPRTSHIDTVINEYHPPPPPPHLEASHSFSFLGQHPHRRPTSSMPHIATPAHHALRRSRGRVNGWSNVEVKDRLTRGLGIRSIIVDHVADFFGGAGRCAASDVPVVAVEGWFAA